MMGIIESIKEALREKKFISDMVGIYMQMQQKNAQSKAFLNYVGTYFKGDAKLEDILYDLRYQIDLANRRIRQVLDIIGVGDLERASTFTEYVVVEQSKVASDLQRLHAYIEENYGENPYNKHKEAI